MQASKVFEPDPAQVHDAREFVAGVLDAWGVHEGDVVLLVSELATNAVLHARSEFDITVRRIGDRLRVEVTDGNSRLPSCGTVPEDANSGRGLLLVQALSGSWGVDTTADGKTVWFEVDIVSS
jgi:anti-sigma regulatory factor (Ser/Thr protein kinase)